MKKTLVINTGGTICMTHENNDRSKPLRPAKSFSEVASNYPFLDELNIDFTQIKEVIDSSNMNSKIWIEVATIIEDNYNDYLGFVVLHGTDTMSFSASALSYMLHNLSKPVILTGAQLPIQQTRSDGLQNLLSSIEIVENSYKNGISCLPEVCVFFRDYLFRGNRSKKLDSANYFGFGSPNYNHLCDAGTRIKFYNTFILEQPSGGFYANKLISDNVFSIRLFPGINPQFILNLVKSNPDLKGLVLQTFGSGNAPTNKEFLDVIVQIRKLGVVIVNITQCQTGSVLVDAYETNQLLNEIDVISGHDMTFEATITKLMYALGNFNDYVEIKNLMENSIAGELTIDK